MIIQDNETMSSKKLHNSEIKLSKLGKRLMELQKHENINQTQLANKLGISNSYLTEIKYQRTKKGGLKFWDAIRREFSEWEDYLRNDVKISKKLIMVSEPSHEHIIHSFKDKTLAKELNELMLKIEKISPEKLERVKMYLEGILEGLETKKKKSHI